MKNFKKLLAVVLAFVMVFATISTAAAGGDDEVVTTTAAPTLSNVEYYKAAVQRLVALNILEGYEDGELRLENNITRAEAVKMMYVLANGTDADGDVASVDLFRGESKFTDVEVDAWYIGYINWAESNGIVNGIGNKQFAPNAEVKFSEVVKMLVKTIAIMENDAAVTEAVEAAKYPYGFIALADNWGLFDGIKEDINGVSNNATRAEVAALIDAALELNDDFISGKFNHVTELADVVFTGTSDLYFAGDTLTAAQVKNVKEKGAKYISLDGVWYVCATETENLIPAAVVKAYLNNDGEVVLISTSAKAVEGKLADLALKSSKYTFAGKAVKFAADAIVYAVNANGLFEDTEKAVSEYANKKVDDTVKFVYADNADDLIDAVIIRGYETAKLNNYKEVAKTVNVTGIGTVALANLKGVANVKAAVEAGTSFYASVSNSAAGLAVELKEVEVIEDVKVTKLQDMDANEVYQTVIAGDKTYIYSDRFGGEKLGADAVATTAEGATPITYDFRLDTDGRIVALRVHPGTEAVADEDEFFAQVKALAVETVAANAGWDSDYKYTLTVVKVADGKEVEIVLPFALALTTEWFHEDQAQSKGVELVEDEDGNKIPAIVGKYVRMELLEGKLNSIAGVDEFNGFDEDAAIAGNYNSAYTGLIKLDGEMVEISRIAAVIYKGQIKTVEEFIALCGDKHDFTAVKVLFNDKIYLNVASLTDDAPVAPTTTTYAYLVMGAHSKVDGTAENTFKYNITATVLGVSRSFESIDFAKNTAGLDNEFTTYRGKLAKATFENGKLAALTAMDTPDHSIVILDRTHGAMWTVAEVLDGNLIEDGSEYLYAADVDEAGNTYVYEYYTVSYAKNTIAEATYEDVLDTEIIDGEIASAQVLGMLDGDIDTTAKTHTVKVFINADITAADLAIVA